MNRRFSVTGLATVLGISVLARGQDAKPAVVYIDDLDITKAVQGYGSPGKNISAESNPVTLKGKTFSHAFGTHADGKMVIDTRGVAKSFSSIVGVDDDTSGAGSVRFYVIGDGKLLAESGILRGNDEPKTLTADLTDVKQLVLRCDVANDGDDNDHADWADAKIILKDGATDKPLAVGVSNAVPELGVFVDELDLSTAEPEGADAKADMSTSGHPITLDGKTFLHGYGTRANGKLVIAVNGAANAFTATVGVDDAAEPADSVRFNVYGDGKLLSRTDVIHHKDKPRELNVDITGVKQLVLKVDAGDSATSDNADWADPKITLDPVKASNRPETVDASTEVKEEAAK